MRSMVEGHARLPATFDVPDSRTCPSTPTLARRDPPPPVGEDFAKPITRSPPIA